MRDETDIQELRHYSLWELAVLAFLREAPMHPYEIQRLLRERHKDEVLVLKRGSLYHAIDRLLRSRLIEVAETGRAGRRPERTTYRITAGGKEELVRWLREMIATPRRESSEFMASVSFLLHLTPKDAMVQLERRAARLEQEIAGIAAGIKQLIDWVQRINLLEDEYLLAMRQAELAWVRGLIGELRSGQLKWDIEKIFRLVRAAKLAGAEKEKKDPRNQKE
jgi:DNA-binding PadR family transcriptional regulator